MKKNLIYVNKKGSQVHIAHACVGTEKVSVTTLVLL
jgi:hypothetical protein